MLNKYTKGVGIWVAKKMLKVSAVLIIMLIMILGLSFLGVNIGSSNTAFNFVEMTSQNTTENKQNNLDVALSSSVADITSTQAYRNNELIVTEQSIDSNNSIKTIQNVQNYLSKGTTGFRTNITKEDSVLNALELPELAIEKMSDDNKNDILNNSYIKVATTRSSPNGYLDESSIDSSDGYMNLHTILMRLENNDEVKDEISYSGYKAMFYCTWLKIPVCRSTDTLAMTSSNGGSVWGDSSTREAEGYFGYIKGGVSDSEEYTLGDDELYEYSEYTFAVHCNLPNVTPGRNYTTMIVMMSSELLSPGHFNLFSAYGHRNVVGTATINSETGVAISFEGNTKNYQGVMLSSISN